MSRRYAHQPIRLQTHFNVGVLVRLEMQRRVLGNKFGSIPEPLSADAFSMSGYCLDAHDIIPAGSTEYHSFGQDRDDWIASPTTIERGEAMP